MIVALKNLQCRGGLVGFHGNVPQRLQQPDGGLAHFRLVVHNQDSVMTATGHRMFLDLHYLSIPTVPGRMKPDNRAACKDPFAV